MPSSKRARSVDGDRKTVFLHIGLEKTGTTTLQTFLWANRAVLATRGYLYPVSAGEPTHSRVAMYAAHPHHVGELFEYEFGESDPASIDRFMSTFPHAFRVELAASAAPRVIISSEHLSSRVIDDDGVERLKSLFGPACDFVVILYLRRQDELLASRYSTVVKGGSSERPAVPEPPYDPWYDFEKLLDFWARHFGRERVRVRLFEKCAFRNGDLIDDFLFAVGIEDREGFENVATTNVSLDVARLDFLRRLNAAFEGHQFGHQVRGDLVVYLDQHSQPEPFTFEPERMEAFMRAFEASNEAVAHSWFRREDGILFAQRGEARVPFRDVTLDEAIRFSAELWASQRSAVIELDTQLKALQGQPAEGPRFPDALMTPLTPELVLLAFLLLLGRKPEDRQTVLRKLELRTVGRLREEMMHSPEMRDKASLPEWVTARELDRPTTIEAAEFAYLIAFGRAVDPEIARAHVFADPTLAHLRSAIMKSQEWKLLVASL